MMKAGAKRLFERVLARRGYVLKETVASPRGLSFSTKHLAELGFEPKTVIDVGVGNGTPWLYEAFPSAHFELFEPLDCFIPAIERICRQFDANYHICALGAECGQAVIEIDREVPTGSTIAGRLRSWKPSKDSELISEPKIVPVRKLDEFAPFAAPVLLKLDVEGYESEVLKGARSTLDHTEIVISEVTVARRHERAMSFGTFMHFMESLGFSFIDVAELSPINRGGPLAYVDAIFTRSDSRFRHCS